MKEKECTKVSSPYELEGEEKECIRAEEADKARGVHRLCKLCSECARQ